MRGELWFLIWVLFLWGSCWGRFVVEKSSLKVTSPEDLKGIYECAIGNFGIPQYGGTMLGFVVYPKSNRKACKSFDEFDISFKFKPGAFPTFLLVDRGGFDLKKINKCVGNPDADEENPVLKVEQDAQIGKGSRGDVTILPTLVINNRQYRGMLDKGAVIKAICAGFQETTEPAVCLSEGIETNECLENNGGYWHDKAANITACRDTFRGRVCECPIVKGVKFVGDGYTHCEASGSGRCEINNGGCWKETKNGQTYSACVDGGCKCPPGFKGGGNKKCEDIDECKERTACQCSGCKCKNTWGSYECGCCGDLLYMKEHDTCISKKPTTEVGWSFIWVIFLGLAAAGIGGYAVYKYRIRVKPLFCSILCLQILCLQVQNPDADEENPVLKAEQDAQIGKGSRGDVTILPTLVINNRQYRVCSLPP